MGVDTRCIIWSDAGEIIVEFTGHSEWVGVCAVFPSGKEVLSISEDGVGLIWQCCGPPGKQLSELYGHKGCINACAVFPSGNRLLTVGDDIIVWGMTEHALPALQAQVEATPDIRQMESQSCEPTGVRVA